MVQINESTKRVLLFLGVLLCVYLIILVSVVLYNSYKSSLENLEAEDEVLEILDDLEDTLEEELILEEPVFEVDKKIVINSVKPDFIQKGSIKISVDEVYAESDGDGSYDIFISVKGEDLHFDIDQSKKSGNFFFRSPLSWNANLLFYASKLHPLLLCEHGADGRFWSATHCINSADLEKGYFGQTIRFVYTDESYVDLSEMSPIAMTKDDRTFVFELVLPKEFYDS